ncbi:MAG: flavodoxin family protein [Firmicutes bacterium]|nr:flavodoxin family protein [Bacillota bacterium]
MSKKVLVLSGSPRKGGNSDILCDEFMRGAQDAGHTVEKIFIRDQKIGFCNACYACRESGVCVLKDGMQDVLDKMAWADVIVMASPVYFYSIDAQMKTVIDRTLVQWTKLPDKEFYYIMTAADSEDEAFDTSLACFRGFAVCLKGSKEMGVIRGGGVYESGAVRETEHMAAAYEMGRNV